MPVRSRSVGLMATITARLLCSVPLHPYDAQQGPKQACITGAARYTQAAAQSARPVSATHGRPVLTRVCAVPHRAADCSICLQWCQRQLQEGIVELPVAQLLHRVALLDGLGAALINMNDLAINHK